MTKQLADQPSSGLEQNGLAKPVVLLGVDTHGVSETPEIVAERYRLNLEKQRLERRLGEIDAVLKVRTGERQVGKFWVKVSSFTVERLDSESAKEILGQDAPMTKSVSVRLSVVPA